MAAASSSTTCWPTSRGFACIVDWRVTKREVSSLGRWLALDLIFSCIAPEDGLHCGRCNKCAERRKGFNELDTPDPTHYAASPGSGEPPEIS